jgi:hypothetical protein
MGTRRPCPRRVLEQLVLLATQLRLFSFLLLRSISSKEYMRTEYDNLHSHIEASETRISQELRAT